MFPFFQTGFFWTRLDIEKIRNPAEMRTLMQVLSITFILFYMIAAAAAAAAATTTSKSQYTPAPLRLPASEEQQHATFWNRLKTLISQEVSQVPFLQILDQSWSNFHKNLDQRITKRLAAEEAKIKEIDDPSKRKYVYIPENGFEKLLDRISTRDPDVLNVVGEKPLVGLVPNASPVQRLENRRKVMWSWVERTSRFVESELNKSAYDRYLALPTGVRPEHFEFLMLDPRERSQAARTGQIKPEMASTFSTRRNLAPMISYEMLIRENFADTESRQGGVNVEDKEKETDDDEDEDDDDSMVEQQVPYLTFPWKFDSELSNEPKRKLD